MRLSWITNVHVIIKNKNMNGYSIKSGREAVKCLSFRLAAEGRRRRRCGGFSAFQAVDVHFCAP